ncbi:aspartyl/asparaginyl beta-hydroxylase domain-containing protein [Rheinheimera sp. 1928-s]|uniref:aspartyl/asparaginyl beta-hydroxylase domain-containing protein n=1 Tax=Rheinheimera sp. 1928-s TaxID=3033803 RepID=UPI0026067AFE|nr:aspartyl/asparaginyl beta-hydroxylase domain-containing protein [Rheinheimera sp. 1928-s]MDF3127066.1 aspartyl/asparaginyl beta-hydroxylase domain-containing protein [Rheinheimera sp. 1928-s]
MNLSLFIIAALVLYSILSVAYVYRWRGQARYQSLSQYLRKSWPVFAPLNCLLYMTTRAEARRPVLDATYLQNISVLRDNWHIIRDEALALQASGIFEQIKTPGSAGYYDVGFRTFYKRGWSKFYLMWYGTTHNSAQRLCPKTLALLKQVPGVQGAMFSILPPGSELSLHADPMASSLRYHLGLDTPNSEHCYISVDGECCSWQNGQDFVFDETYPHHAKNNTQASRLILMCDVERPMNLLGRFFNLLYRFIIKGTVVPNTTEDKTGMFSALFASMAPLRQSTLKLRTERRRLYKALKITLNTSLLAMLFAILFAFFSLFESFLSARLWL